jgi:hypothetical protein
MSSGQREQGMHALRGRRHAGLVRLMVLGERCQAALPDSRSVRGKTCTATMAWSSAWTRRFDADWGPCQTGLPPAFRTVFQPGLASDGSGVCARHCTTVLQPPMQTLRFESSQSISRRPSNASGYACIPQRLFEAAESTVLCLARD